MDCLKLLVNKCRICLEENGDMRWDAVLYGFSDLTYKDCYYKYTQLEYHDGNNLPTMFCRNCTNGLEYIDSFISKAVESHSILQEKLRFNELIIEEDNIKEEPTNFETILMESTEIKQEIQSSEDSNEAFASTKERGSEFETPLLPLRKRKRRTLKTNKTKNVKIATDVMNPDETQKLDGKTQSRKQSIYKQPMCCTICSKVLRSKYMAIKHEKTHIENRERNETCVECGLKFYSKEILKSHMLTHLENRIKPHKCEFCDKAFYSKGALNIHRRIHLGQMISCNLCPKEFYRQVDLDIHMNSHSAVAINSTVKIKTKCFIQCKECGKNVRSASFRNHNAIHMNEPLYKCSICDKEFFHRTSCVKHLKRTHKKTSGDTSSFVVRYKNNRLSHLYLKQNTNIQEEKDELK